MENDADLKNVDISLQKPKKKIKFKTEPKEFIDTDIPRPKKKKRSKKSAREANDDMSDEVVKPKKRKNKIKNDVEESIKKEIMKDISENDDVQSNEAIDWPQSDLSRLLKRIERVLPEKDNLAYSTRVEKLNWDDIAFDHYGAEDCKKTWFLIQKKVRRFRLLIEVLQDAKEWIYKPWTNFYRGNKTKRHPDMPRRPLSVYMIFYLKKKDKILEENPGMEMTEISKKIAQMYKTISPAKREKYMQLAAAERKAYEEKLQQFYLIHPEIRYIEKAASTKLVETGPEKPSTPFGMYFKEQLKNFYSESEGDRTTFKEQCKEQWKNMSDKKKLVWIDWALEEEAKYQDALKHCMSQNPNFVPPASVKPVLTKEERILKERLAGKPIKPPNSAYSLFSRMMLQGEEIKKIDPRSRMKAIADQWKNCSDKEKKQYRERANHMMDQYKLDFASYLESLPEDKRKEELQNNLPKRKIKDKDGEVVPKKKKINSTENETNKGNEVNKVNGINNVNEESSKCNKENKKDDDDDRNIIERGVKVVSKKKEETLLEKALKEQPAHPPVSGFFLFSKRYHGKIPVKTAWKNLGKVEKREYEVEVQKLKQKYIKEYEIFLKSLTRDQLTAYSEWKKKEVPATSDTKNSEAEDSNSCESESENEISNGY